MQFGILLKEYRELKGMTQQDFIKKFFPGLALKTYQSWEQGYRRPAPFFQEQVISRIKKARG